MNFRWIKALIFAVLSVMGIGLSSLAANAQLLDISVARAPVVPDGTTAGAETDFVLTFEDRNPTVNGKSMFTNGTVTVELPDSFTRSAGSGPPDTLILLQGWPQSPPTPPFPWTITVVGNTITATMTGDYKIGDFGPGMKQVHLLLREFRNPGPGRYPVSLAVDPDGDGTPSHSGIGYVKIIPRARPSVNVVSFFSGPPGPPPPFFNPLYQTMSIADLGNTTPRQAGLYLWEADSIPALGVDVLMTNPNHGRLIQGRRTVGQVLIQAPAGASGYELTTTGASSAIDTGVTGRPTGLLIVRFVPDPNVKGDYAIDISMNGGNTERMFVTVN